MKQFKSRSELPENHRKHIKGWSFFSECAFLDGYNAGLRDGGKHDEVDPSEQQSPAPTATCDICGRVWSEDHTDHVFQRVISPAPATAVIDPLRFQAACAAMQGQVEFEGMEGCDKELIAGMSVELADALLSELSKSK